eukprot:8772454-Alexandrium_andersonii.AAC.1
MGEGQERPGKPGRARAGQGHRRLSTRHAGTRGYVARPTGSPGPEGRSRVQTGTMHCSRSPPPG